MSKREWFLIGFSIFTFNALAEQTSGAAGGVDVAGPFKLTLPADLCQRELPPSPVRPPDDPISLQEAERSEEKREALIRYYALEEIRNLQKTYCAPVVPREVASASSTTLPRECTSPPDPRALFDPIHPMVDTSRADVKEALHTYLKTKSEYEALVIRCMALAGHPPAATPDTVAAPPEAMVQQSSLDAGENQ